MALNIKLPFNIQQNNSNSQPIWNPSTGQFEYEPHTPPMWNSPKSKVEKITKDEIENIPIYPENYTPEVQPTKTMRNYSKHKTRKHNHMIPQLYENPKYDPYIHMGILYKYSLRLLEKSKSLSQIEPLIDRYNQLLKIDIYMPYLEKPDNIIHTIFINKLNNNLKQIQNIKYTPQERDAEMLILNILQIKFNNEIHNDIKELSKLSNKINDQNVHVYASKFNAFNQKYFTDGIIEMISTLYKNKTNNTKHNTIYDVKKDLFHINKDIMKKYKNILSRPANATRANSRRSKPTQSKSTRANSRRSKPTQSKSTRTSTASKRKKATNTKKLHVPLGRAI